MRKRLFRTTLLSTCALLLLLTLVFTAVFYQAEKRQLTTSLTEETELLASALSGGADEAVLLAAVPRPLRATLIDADGTVLRDTAAAAATMENHASREEFRLAVKDGSATVVRASSTLQEEMVYHTQLLSSGAVLRLAAAQKTLLSRVLSMLPLLLLGLCVCAGLAALLSAGSTRSLLAPINAIDPEHPLDADCYEELTPLLRRLHQQQQLSQSQLEAIRSQKAEQDEMFSHMREGLCILDGMGRVVTLNDAAREIMGLAEADCLGRSLIELDRNAALLQLLSECSQTGSAQGPLCAAGRHYHVSVSRIGQQEGTLLLLLDDTADMEAEGMRRQFTANVSHELRTPLTAINGYAEMMQNGMVPEKDREMFLGRIRHECDRMLRLVEDIIRLSQLDEGSVKLQAQPVSLAELTKDVAVSLLPKATERGVTISPVTGDQVLVTDPTLLHEIVYNLADNGVKYSRKGGHVRISATEQGGCLALTVSDDGIGIPKEHQKKIFERFYRVDKSRSKATGGTGLGLSIVKHACQLLCAEVKLESEPGSGTTITVLFPIRETPAK